MTDHAAEELLAEIRAFCAAHADPQVAARYARYFKEGYDPYGVPEEAWPGIREEWVARYRDRLGLAGFLDLGGELFASGKYEEGGLAIRLIAQFKGEFDRATFQRLGRWLEAVRNWAHCDVLCGDLLSWFLTAGLASLDDMGDWRTSPAKYKRRAVPVAMIGVLKETKDVGPLLDFIRPLMTDPERVVQQGLGWFLREAWKRWPGPVETFLLEWKDTAPRLIFQYATEKMSPEAKARFRRRNSPLRKPMVG
ncbi:DNA alkylation repair protein [Candidatus Bipolaricaulota bacterium]|nr:DNA alkylation repair protein [Candidatus Bipolaricaulota bacterium]